MHAARIIMGKLQIIYDRAIVLSMHATQHSRHTCTHTIISPEYYTTHSCTRGKVIGSVIVVIVVVAVVMHGHKDHQIWKNRH